MKLLFTVEVTLDVPDNVVAQTLGIDLEDLDPEDLDALAVGNFGELQFVAEADTGATMLSYTTQENVEALNKDLAP